MAYKLTLYTVFVALLPGMNSCEVADVPGMFISSEMVNSRFEQSMDWNTEHPFREINVAGENYTLLCMGDSHVGGTDNLDFFFNEATRLNAAGAIMAGDLTTGHSYDYAVFKAHLPDPEALPVFAVAGNHDLYFDGWDEFYRLLGSTTYLFSIRTPTSKDLYICLDSGSGTLGSKQIGWLEEVLKTTRPMYRRCVVVTHCNFFRVRHTLSTNPVTEELRELIALFAKFHVDMAITGHDHVHNVVQFGHTTHITMDALKDGLKHSGYLRLDVNGGQLKFSFIQLP